MFFNEKKNYQEVNTNKCKNINKKLRYFSRVTGFKNDIFLKRINAARISVIKDQPLNLMSKRI